MLAPARSTDSGKGAAVFNVSGKQYYTFLPMDPSARHEEFQIEGVGYASQHGPTKPLIRTARTN
jgi:hypothetical protein